MTCTNNHKTTIAATSAQMVQVVNKSNISANRDKMIEGIANNIEVKRADEMAETGYLVYRIKKKNNIENLSSLRQETLRNLIIKIEGKKDVDQKLKRLVKLLSTIDNY